MERLVGRPSVKAPTGAFLRCFISGAATPPEPIDAACLPKPAIVLSRAWFHSSDVEPKEELEPEELEVERRIAWRFFRRQMKRPTPTRSNRTKKGTTTPIRTGLRLRGMSGSIANETVSLFNTHPLSPLSDWPFPFLGTSTVVVVSWTEVETEPSGRVDRNVFVSTIVDFSTFPVA